MLPRVLSDVRRVVEETKGKEGEDIGQGQRGGKGDTQNLFGTIGEPNRINVTALYNATGTVIERYNYKPYGQLDVLNASYTSTGTNSTVANPYTYTGRRFDTETELYYYRNRYYDSQLGRFISRDPIGYEGSRWNLSEGVWTKGTPRIYSVRSVRPSESSAADGVIGSADCAVREARAR